MIKSLKTLAAIGLVLSTAAAYAEPPATPSLNGNADLCFDEARKAVSADKTADLSTMPCRRALRHEPISRADRSAMLHNRGIIEQAQGDLKAAKVSFAQAVRLSVTVDRRNLALAQVAHKLGDFDLAVQQYDLWIEQGSSGQDAESRERTLANRQQAARSLAGMELAKRQ